MGTDILAQIRAAGITLSADGGNLLATPRAAITDEIRTLIREHKAELLAALTSPDLPGVSTEFAARLSAEDLEDIAVGEIPLATVQAFEQAAIAREAEDLKEFFEERSAILEFDAGLPRPEAEIESARVTATLPRNRGYLWASLREALADYPLLLSQVPDTPGTVDSLPLGTARVHVREGARSGPFSGSVAVITDAELDAARKGRIVVRQGAFSGAPEVKA